MYKTDTISSLVKDLTDYKKLYDYIRVVDPITKEVLSYHEDEWINQSETCYHFWKTGLICSNCTSMRAINQNETIVKTKYRDNQAFLVTAIPTTINGRKVSIELLKDISNSVDMMDDQINELKMMIEKANELIVRDSLTSIYNRRFIIERLPAEQKGTAKNNAPLSIVMADIDYFKKVNDVYGHLFGDYILKEFAKILYQSLPTQVDWVARYGGEEFLISLPNTPKKDALLLAESIRKKIETAQFTYESNSINITASFGVAENMKEDTYDSLINKADQALYIAKNTGRNKVQ